MKIDPLEIQFHLVHDCIRAIIYADYIETYSPKADAWLSIKDMFYSEAVIAWNAIFGTNSQNSHWKKLSEKLPIPKGSKLKPFGKELIIEELKITTEEWEQYHLAMVNMRNERIAHFNFEVTKNNFPNVSWALRSAYLYREWLITLLKEHNKTGMKYKITTTTNEDMVDLFKGQIAEICK